MPVYIQDINALRSIFPRYDLLGPQYEFLGHFESDLFNWYI